MKKIVFVFAFLSLSLFALANHGLPVHIEFGFLKNVTLKAGTPVVFETAEQFASGTMTVGQNVKFTVKMNVIAEGKVAINTGSIAIGRVKDISSTSFNNPETITIELTSVQAVDGSQIILNGTEQTFKGTFPGEDASVNGGKTIIATVLNDVTIKAN